jgi:hypothetical protein
MHGQGGGEKRESEDGGKDELVDGRIDQMMPNDPS